MREQLVEIRRGALQSFAQSDTRAPAHLTCRQSDVRLPLHGIVCGQRLEHQLRSGTRQFNDHFRELADGEFARVAKIQRSGKALRRVHKTDETLDQVIDITKGSRLPTLTVNRDGLTSQRLHNEVRHDAPVVRMHARAVGIENPCDLDVELVLPVIVEKERLCAALALVVTRPDADRVDVAPVTFRLRMHGRITIHLAGGRLKDAAL